ncbi:uncharacterized protein LOC126182412 [Schistocerca cancellata]|uniref:uncharacterized protein LOC126182412 n=1 Tax=Schistocerca cancellata TaxID=274614 RepID=UPI002117BADF|nr:uncharacterized protein LOC126182412 [Schistocerca cancellata]
MAKELFIMFVYDTQKCQKEEDDPQEAVVYFHPAWVTEQQKMVLCGQLMGATQFFRSSFSCPNILCLNSGKFLVWQCGRFILTVGTDQNIDEWILKYRSKVLLDLLRFYHNDFETIHSSAGPDGSKFAEKLQQIFEIYVPIVQHSGNIFANMPSVRLPKSASSIFLEAIQILHSCQEKKGVLSGTILHQNRIVATQLSPDLTRTIIYTDPYRIRSPAEHLETHFHLPIGVQLLKVYVDGNEYSKMLTNLNTIGTSVKNISIQKLQQPKVSSGKPQTTKEQLSSMKRDTSRIFTVPEEKEDGEHVETTTSFNGLNGENASLNNDMPDKPSYSIAATPLKELNVGKVLHAKVMSICRGSNNTVNDDESKSEKVPSFLKRNNEMILKQKTLKNSKSINNFLSNYCETEGHSLSLNDINKNTKITSKRVPLRCYSFGLPRVTRKLCHEEDISPEEKLSPGKHFFNTITDPLFPVFRWDGVPISHSLFDEYVSRHYELLDMERTQENTATSNMKLVSHEDEISVPDVSHSSNVTTENHANSSSLQSAPTGQIASASDNGASLSKQEMYRRSLSLPLKTINMSEDCGDSDRQRSVSCCEGEVDSPVLPKYTGPLQLTPLLSKLSLLAHDEKSGGISEKDKSFNELSDLKFSKIHEESIFPANTENRKCTEKSGNTIKVEEEVHQSALPKEACLYLYRQQHMTMALVLEFSAAQDPEIIHSLWQTSVNGLNHLEARLKHCLEYFPHTEVSEQYSFLCLDPNWDMLHRGGPWGPSELDTVSCLHESFIHSPNLTEIVVRCEDRTVYGYQCGNTEVFYQQSTGDTAGLPTPSDLMGTVSLKARRRLERDHGIVLL